MQNVIKRQMETRKALLRSTARVKDTPYTTLCHRDLHGNNIMIKKANAEEPIKVKILDFQEKGYGSFAFDVEEFLVQNYPLNDLRKNFKVFFEYYHSEFVNMLQLFNCPLNDYTHEK